MSSKIRHTSCALVTGGPTCALPLSTTASGSSGQRGLPGAPASCARIHLQREINPGACDSKENNGSRALVPGAGTLRAQPVQLFLELDLQPALDRFVVHPLAHRVGDRKSTRLNSRH